MKKEIELKDGVWYLAKVCTGTEPYVTSQLEYNIRDTFETNIFTKEQLEEYCPYEYKILGGYNDIDEAKFALDEWKMYESMTNWY